MCPQSGHLLGEVGAHIDPVADLRARRPRLIECRGFEILRSDSQGGGRSHGAGDGFAGEGRLEQRGGTAGQHGGGAYGSVHLEMVRMPVPALWVVSDDDVGGLLVEQPAYPAGDGKAVLMGESIRDLAVKARVAVAERLQAMHSEDVG